MPSVEEELPLGLVAEAVQHEVADAAGVAACPAGRGADDPRRRRRIDLDRVAGDARRRRHRAHVAAGGHLHELRPDVARHLRVDPIRRDPDQPDLAGRELASAAFTVLGSQQRAASEPAASARHGRDRVRIEPSKPSSASPVTWTSEKMPPATATAIDSSTIKTKNPRPPRQLGEVLGRRRRREALQAAAVAAPRTAAPHSRPARAPEWDRESSSSASRARRAGPRRSRGRMRRVHPCAADPPRARATLSTRPSRSARRGAAHALPVTTDRPRRFNDRAAPLFVFRRFHVSRRAVLAVVLYRRRFFGRRVRLRGFCGRLLACVLLGLLQHTALADRRLTIHLREGGLLLGAGRHLGRLHVHRIRALRPVLGVVADLGAFGERLEAAARDAGVMDEQIGVLPSSGVMKPYPFSSLNHLTVPVAIVAPPGVMCGRRGRVLRGNYYERWHHFRRARARLVLAL